MDDERDDKKMDDERDDKKMDNSKTGQVQAPWDGITQGRQSWAGKTVAAMQPLKTEKRGLWFTHKAIQKRLQDHAGGLPENLAHVLYGLVKSGHLERAHKPNKIKQGYAAQQNYIYRLTGKAYKEKPFMNDVERGLQIKLENPRLAKWFRDMMIYD